MIAAPVLGFLGAAITLIGIRMRAETSAVLGSALSTLGIIATVGLSMFPIILSSSIDTHPT